MFSSKTTLLIGAIKFWIQQGKSVSVIKYYRDKRYQNPNESLKIKTHSGLEIEAISCDETLSLDDVTLKSSDVIAIDEGHFFVNLLAFCVYMKALGKIVLVAGLDMDSELKNWSSTEQLAIECAKKPNEIKKLSAFCKRCGCSAVYTKKLTESKTRIEIGGAEIYSPVCLQHYME